MRTILSVCCCAGLLSTSHDALRYVLATVGVFGAYVGIATATLQTAALAATDTIPIIERHTDITREIASGQPRHENDQVVVNGWPMYRTERGQEAFNHAMATLRITNRAAPSGDVFRGCEDLLCRLTLPKLSSSGWIPAGRLWVSPDAYILIVHSPRRSKYDPGRRRSRRSMRYFVFHEFHNSTGNTDVFDTISAHRSSVFVPFYLGKPGRDAQGRRYVVMVQVAPHDIVSRHAANKGNAGPGIEVAKNTNQRLSRLQAQAGVLVAAMVKRAEPQLRIVHHRNSEGLPMLRAYRRQVSAARRTKHRIRLPFVRAPNTQVARATGRLKDIIVHSGPARITSRPTITAGIPQLVSAPRLVQIFRQPVKTIDQLIRRLLRMPVVPPKPRPACRSAPGYVCR